MVSCTWRIFRDVRMSLWIDSEAYIKWWIDRDACDVLNTT